MKQIAVLGSTGSIGRQALDIIGRNREGFRVIALSADSNAELLAKQANKFIPEYIGIRDLNAVDTLRKLLNYNPVIYVGDNSAAICAALNSADIVLNAVSGIAGLKPLWSALKAGKTIAAANKESIICANSILNKLKPSPDAPLTAPFSNGARIIPVDSEQCAIFQCLQGEEYSSIKRLILTASGGVFHKRAFDAFDNISPQEAMNNPNWSMGKKITIDSSTMFNKGLEIMEASYLFGIPGNRIDVVVQPKSIIHSMVEFCDNSVKAQLAVPDMRAAIQYAFDYPQRAEAIVDGLDFIALGEIRFESVNPKLKSAIELSYAALHEGGALPIVYNAANEAAVDLFVKCGTRFTDIPLRVEYAMSREYACEPNSLDDIIAIDTLAREYAIEWKGR